MTDRRKFNTPPARPPALDAETVAAIDEVVAKGVKQTWVARQLGVHDKTIEAVVNRKGAYKSVPRFNAEVRDAQLDAVRVTDLEAALKVAQSKQTEAV